MNEGLFKEYASLKRQEKLIAEMIAEIGPQVLAELEKYEVDELEMKGQGKFMVSKRKTWVYPEEIIQLGETLKAKKKEAEQKGFASFTEKPELRLTLTKDEQGTEEI